MRYNVVYAVHQWVIYTCVKGVSCNFHRLSFFSKYAILALLGSLCNGDNNPSSLACLLQILQDECGRFMLLNIEEVVEDDLLFENREELAVFLQTQLVQVVMS